MLDLCHELYVSGQENVFWQPENEEHQRRRWLAPKGEAPKPVSKVPKHVAAVSRLASTCAPVALTSERAHRTTQPTMASYVVGQTSPAPELSRTYIGPGKLRCQVPSTRTLLAPAVSVLEKSRVPAFQRAIQHPAVPVKQVHQTAPRVT